MVGKTGMSAGKTGSWCLQLHPRGLESALSASFLTQFDGKTRGELHLNELPEFIKVLEGCDHLQNIQQPETKHVVTHQKLCTNMAGEKTHDSMPRGKS